MSERSEFTSSAIFGVIFREIYRAVIFLVLGACPALDAGYQDKKNRSDSFANDWIPAFAGMTCSVCCSPPLQGGVRGGLMQDMKHGLR